MTINAKKAMENVQKFHERVEVDYKAKALAWVEEHAVLAIEQASNNGNRQVTLDSLPESGAVRNHIKNELVMAGFAVKEGVAFSLMVRWGD